MSSAGFIRSASPLYRRVVPEYVLPKKSVTGNGDLTQEQKSKISELKARDREVRAHEQAHMSVGGRYVGTITYDYVQGPDGHRYATSGEALIDASPVEGDLEATIAKMEIVRAAALAPVEPSAQDHAVAQLAQARLLSALSLLRDSHAPETDDPDQVRSIGSLEELIGNYPPLTPLSGESRITQQGSTWRLDWPRDKVGNAYTALVAYVNHPPRSGLSFFA